MLLYAAMMDGEEAAAEKLATVMPAYPERFGPMHMSDGESTPRPPRPRPPHRPGACMIVCASA